MENVEISTVLKSLYDNLVNEIDNQLGGALDGKTSMLADAVKSAVKHTHNQFCDPSDRIN